MLMPAKSAQICSVTVKCEIGVGWSNGSSCRDEVSDLVASCGTLPSDNAVGSILRCIYAPNAGTTGRHLQYGVLAVVMTVRWHWTFSVCVLLLALYIAFV